MRQAVFSRAWTIPKHGNSTEQNEDAWRLEPFVHGPWRQGMLMALADGTTEAVYSGPWARTLVAAAEPDWPVLDPAEWEQRLDVVKRQFAPLDRDSAVPWYVRNKYLTQGSQATFLAVTLCQEPGLPGRVLRALAVGDCCLFLLRPRAQVFAFPLVESIQFGQNPALITNRAQPALDVQRCEALVQPGDLLVACSDALARWLLQAIEMSEIDKVFDLLAGLLAGNRTSLWTSPSHEADWRGWKHWLKSVRTWLRTGTDEPASPPTQFAAPAGEFDASIARERGAESLPRLRNDDTTLIVCLPLESPPNTRPATVPEKIEELRQQFATAPVTVRPLQEAGVPESSRRWLLPWNLHESIS
jgi:hypothetical protein